MMRRTGAMAGLMLAVATIAVGLGPAEASHEYGHMVVEVGPLRLEFDRVGVFSDQSVSSVQVDTPSKKLGQTALVLATFSDPSGITPNDEVTVPMFAFGFQEACDIVRNLPTAQSCEKIPGTIQNLHAANPSSSEDAFVSCIHDQSLTVSFGASTILQTSQLKEVVNGPCGSAGMVGNLDEGPNDCNEELPVVQPRGTVTGTVVNAEDRHDFFALEIKTDLVNQELGIQITSLMRLDASIPTPAFLRVWAPNCAFVLAEALPNGEISEIATFVPSTPGFYPVEVFLGERGSAPIEDPLVAIVSEVQCLGVEQGGQYWNCPGAADQYAFESFVCHERPFGCLV